MNSHAQTAAESMQHDRSCKIYVMMLKNRQSAVNVSPQNQDSTKDIDAAVNTLVSKVCDASAAATTFGPQGSRTSQTGLHRGGTSSEIDELLLLKKRLRHEYIRTNEPQVDRVFRRVASRVRKKLAEQKTDATDRLLSEATADVHSNYDI
ncbi:GL20430 [Drosophila persimilis]|uniref:GL20430 n=1 Tax=Drosophila persimilis TaxID=7234 RepID=B4HBW9_DROPE|nr:GL20430 [Drosophila persimilis]